MVLWKKLNFWSFSGQPEYPCCFSKKNSLLHFGRGLCPFYWYLFRLASAITLMTAFISIRKIWTPLIFKKGEGRNTRTYTFWCWQFCHIHSMKWSHTPVSPYKTSGIISHQLGLLDSNDIKMSSITLFVSFLMVILASVSDACQPSQAVKDCYATCVSITN